MLSALGERADEEERAGGVVEARLAARQRTKLGRVGSTLRVETKRGRGLGSRNSSWLANAIRQCVTHADGDGDATGRGEAVVIVVLMLLTDQDHDAGWLICVVAG